MKFGMLSRDGEIGAWLHAGGMTVMAGSILTGAWVLLEMTMTRRAHDHAQAEATRRKQI
ncbi:MAG: hypothetical protein ACE5GJ_08215 [Gemmatimonadota bacterium]